MAANLGAIGSHWSTRGFWNGADWTEAAPASNPVPRLPGGMTFFSGTGTVLMLVTEGLAGSTHHVYSWDGGQWTDLPHTGGPPRSVVGGEFSVDPERQVVVLLAHDINLPTFSTGSSMGGRGRTGTSSRHRSARWSRPPTTSEPAPS